MRKLVAGSLIMFSLWATSTAKGDILDKVFKKILPPSIAIVDCDTKWGKSKCLLR